MIIDHFYQLCPLDGCGKYAFEWRKEPIIGQAITAADIRHLDHPKAGDPITCQFCKREIPADRLTVKNIIHEAESTTPEDYEHRIKKEENEDRLRAEEEAAKNPLPTFTGNKVDGNQPDSNPQPTGEADPATPANPEVTQ